MIFTQQRESLGEVTFLTLVVLEKNQRTLRNECLFYISEAGDMLPANGGMRYETCLAQEP